MSEKAPEQRELDWSDELPAEEETDPEPDEKPYRDGSAVASYARIPLGWALSADILSEQNGMLKPGGAVSRGQLALSLYRLRQLL